MSKITESVELGDNLCESEALYLTLFNKSLDAVFLTAPDGSILNANLAACQMFGRTVEEICQMGRSGIIDTTDPRLPIALEERNRTGKFFGELIGLKQDGSKFPIELASTIFKGKDNHVHTSIVIRDITERKRTEKALKESEDRFHALFTQMSEGFAYHEVIYDSAHNAIDYRILDINSAYEKQVGIKAEKATGELATQLYGVYPAPFIDIYARVAETGEHQMFQSYFSPLDRYFDISAFSPNPGYFATVFTDVTDRKRTEEALKNSEIKYKRFFEDDLTGDFILNGEGVILDCNSSFLEIFGYSNKQEIIGKNVILFYENPSEFENIKERLKQYKKLTNIEVTRKRKDGKLIEILENKVASFDREGEINEIKGFIFDITERKRAEKALKTSEARLHELNATKDKFFSIIAHDLKSPFNTILGFSSILSEQVKAKDYAGIEEYAEIIHHSSQRAMDLLTNLLEWSRSQTGRMTFNPEYVDMVTLISETADLLNDSARQKSISFTLSLPPKLYGIADRDMIKSVLRNLFSNAIKFTHSGGSIVISAEQKRNELMVVVKDNGLGIEKNNLEKLFMIGENLSTSGTQNEKGTGLGLLLSKEFIDKHGGKIWVESEPGKGSIFYFTIPRV